MRDTGRGGADQMEDREMNDTFADINLVQCIQQLANSASQMAIILEQISHDIGEIRFELKMQGKHRDEIAEIEECYRRVMRERVGDSKIEEDLGRYFRLEDE